MIGLARHQWQQHIVVRVFAICGCSLLLTLGAYAGDSRNTARKQPAQDRQKGQDTQNTQTQKSQDSQKSDDAQATPKAQKSGDAPNAQNTENTQNKPTTQKAQTPQTAQKHLTVRERAWQDLQDGLKENSGDKRAKAVNALGLLTANPEAEKAAMEALKDDQFHVRIAAATALGSMHAVHAVPQLLEALDDQEPAVVLAAANSLMLLKDNHAYDVYYGVLTGKTRPNRGFVQEQLKQLRDPKMIATLGFEEGIGFVPFAGVGYEVVKRVLKSSSDSSLSRAAAAKKLAHDPNAASGDALVDATQDKSWIVRAAALDAIAQRGDKTMLPKITGSLTDSRDDVRYMAAACIVHLKDVGVKRRAPAKKAQ